MCAMHMLCKKGTVCLRVTDPHLIFDRICVCTIRTHMCCIIPTDLALALKQVLSLYPIPLIPPLLSGTNIKRNSTSGIIIDLEKKLVVVLDGFVIRVKNVPPHPFFTPYH